MAGHIETAAYIGGYSQEPTVGGIQRHIGEGTFLGEFYGNAVAMGNAKDTLQRIRQSKELFARSEIIEG